MIKKRYYVKSQDLCFYIFWIALMACKGFAFKSDDQQAQVVAMLVVPFAIMKILLSRWKKRELVRSICLGFIGIAIWFCSGKSDTLVIMITIVASKDVDIYNLFQISFWVRGMFFVLRISSALLGFSDMQQVFYTRGVEDTRYALGYGHPNTAHYELFVIVVLAILIWHKRMKIVHYMALCVSNYLLYCYTRSRTGVIVTFFVLFLGYLMDKKRIGRFGRIIAIYGRYSYIVSAVCSILICLLVEWLPVFRSYGTFSSRFWDGQRALRNVPLSLFGVPIYDVLDMGLINMLVGRGVVFFVLFLYGMTLLLKLFYKRGMYVEEMVGIAYAVYSMMEAGSNTIMMNIILLFLAWVIYPGNSAASTTRELVYDKWDEEKTVYSRNRGSI